MSHPPVSRRRRVLLPTVALTLVAVVAPLAGANPAAAATAPLTTTDGVGIRVDENAILGPALEAIETELQPFVDQMIYDGAVENTPVGDPDAINVDSNLELGFDMLVPGPGMTDGGVKVHADIESIDIEYRKDAWWHSECGIYVNPYDASIDVTAEVNRARLPDAPLEIQPITANWDPDPDVSTSGACWTYLIDDFFAGFFGSGDEGSIADNIEDELNAEAQDLIDSLWADHVMPVIDSLGEYGITFNQIRTDDHGLIVTANVDATNGISIPGLGGPFSVVNTPDSGVTSNVNTVLAARSEVTATIHPNVAAQFLNALNQGLAGEWGVLQADPSIETILLPSGLRGAYADAGWSIRYRVVTSPSVTPTGPGGRPVVNLPTISLEISNTSFPATPVATFTGTLSGLSLVTEVRPGSSNFGPSIYATNAILSNVVRTQTNGDALTPTASQLQPFARSHWDRGSTFLFEYFISLPPINIGGLAVTLCTSCPRVSGDQRYTEFFNVA